MKKILAISFIAMSAVSAANANIASQKYVDDRTGTLTNLTTDAKTSLVAAINEVDSHADANAGDISAINTKLGDVPNGTTVAAMIAAAQEAAEGDNSTLAERVAANETNIGTNTTNIATNASGITAINTKLGDANAADFTKLHGVTADVTELNYVDGVTSNIQTQLNSKANSSFVGELPAEAQSTTVTGYIDEAITNAGGQTAGQVSSAIDTKVGTLNGTLGAGDVATGNVVTQVTEADGIVTVTHGNAVNNVAQGSGTGNVITSVTLNADGQTIDVNKTIKAIPEPSGNCTDCVLHYNGTVYTWEEITRGTQEVQG